MRDILLLSMTIICALAALRRPVYGMLAYITYSFWAPHSLVWGPARTFPHVQLIAVCTLLSSAFSTETWRVPKQREVLLLLALWSMFTFSTFFAIEPARALAQLNYVSKILLMVFLCLFLINSEQKLHWLMRAIALSIGFHGLKIGLFVIRTGGQQTVYGPDASFLEANNSLGMALAVNVPLLFYMASMERILWLRRVMKAMMIFSFPAVAGTFSRGAWIALGVVTLFMVSKSRYRFFGVLALGFIFLTSPLWITQIVSEQMVSRFDTLKNYEEDQSAQSRFWNWEFCARVGFARPLYGGGFDYYSMNAYAEYFPEFLARWPGKVWSCHNMWLTMFGEQGIPGFLLWVSLMGCYFGSLRKIRASAHSQEKLQWALPYVNMLQAALLAYIISGSFLDIAYFEMYYFLIAVVVIIKERIREQQEATSTIPSVTPVSVSRWQLTLTGVATGGR